ncbi:hypothetical protein NUSPORA_00618 [Nucleospora cyclopteri]
MFVALFAVDTENEQKVFRSTKSLSQSKISFYLTEFLTQVKDGEGIIERETYDYAYTSNNGMFYGAQIEKGCFLSEAFLILKNIKDNANRKDIFDILLHIDNILYNGQQIIDNVSVIKKMESQDEKIYNLIMDSKRIEMMEKAKEYEKQTLNKQLMEQYKQNGIGEQKAAVKKPAKKIEKSAEPILLILKEKLNVRIDKENFIKENSISGELSMVISEAKYRNIQIKMKNFPPACKFSPYLEKSALKRSILKFDKERQLNKNIPLLKWAGKMKQLPITLDCWADEEEGKFCSTLTFNAGRKINNLKICINHADITDLEIDGKQMETDMSLFHSEMDEKQSVNHEVKYAGFDGNGIFPMCLSFEAETDSKMSLENILLEGEEVKSYEFRKILEIEKYEISVE